MLRQPLVECGGLAAAFEPAAPLSYPRGASCILRRPLGHSVLCPIKNFLATCTSSVPPLSCAHRIPLVSYAVTVAQPTFPTRNCFSPLAVFPRRFPVTPFSSSACGLFFSLAALFQTPILCFQSFADSLRKTPGGMGSCASAVHESQATNHESRKFCRPFVFMVLQIAFPASSFVSQSSALPPGCHPLNIYFRSSRTQR